MPPDIPEAVQATVAAAFGMVILAVMVSLFLGGAASVTPVTGDNVTIDDQVDNVPGQVTVTATRGNALAFPGEGWVEAPEIDNGSVTVCASGELADGAHTQATYTLFADRNGSVLLQYDAGAWMFYVEDGGQSAKATVAAPDPGDWTGVCGRYNATASTVTVSNDTAISAPVAMDTSTERRNVSSDWYGRIDEVRTFGNSVADNTLAAYGDDAVQPFPAENRTGRLMLDEGEGSTTTVYWADQDATIVNASWTNGISNPSLDRGSDYRLTGNPFSLFVPAGGYLDGAPVTHISWLILPLGFDIVGVLGAMIGLAIIAFIGKELMEQLQDI